jgi:hypothetical protein
MGEYATRKSDSENVKIGTCEDMYYLRFDQRWQVLAEPGNVDPVNDAEALRFRFPWPDEDLIRPGDFEDYNKGVRIDGLPASADVEHYSVQFSAPNGYLVSLPCPESAEYVPAPHGSLSLIGVNRTEAIRVHKNGYGGACKLVAQKFRPGIGLVPIMKCNACGAMWRIEDREGINCLVGALRAMAAEAERRLGGAAKYYQTIADRVLAGIAEEVQP